MVILHRGETHILETAKSDLHISRGTSLYALLQSLKVLKVYNEGEETEGAGLEELF